MDLASPLDAAEAYASHGWRVVPIGPRTKHPRLQDWRNAATDDLDTIRSWWTGLYRGHGVGIVTGAATGLWVLDVDVADGKPGANTLAAMNDAHGKLPETVTAITGSGGLHLLFNWDPARPVTNGQSTGLGPGLDIRGEGGQIVVAPTIHPNGSPYQWHPERHPWAIDVADAPDWLYKLLNQPPAPEPTPEGASLDLPRNPATTDESPADYYRANTTWEHLLGSLGWGRHHTRGDDTYWTRPGKNPRDGHSAVQHGHDGPLVIFTTEIDPALERLGRPNSDRSGISVTKFDVYAATSHAGDTSAAARHIRATMPTPTPPALPATANADGQDHEPDGPQPGPADVGHWWDDNTPPKVADTLIRTDGQGLLYADELNWIHGDSGSGKTWVLLHAIVQLVRAARPVLWVHYEDPTPATIIRRLKLLGLNRTEAVDRFHYWDPQGEPFDTHAIHNYCTTHGIGFVALDSVGEALNAEGLEEDKDAQVGPWLTRGPRALVNAGIGFCGVDHGTKGGERPLHPSGSKRKRAAITGAGLLVESVVAPTQHSAGELKILCAKDRHGNHPQGAEIARVHVEPSLVTGLLSVTAVAPDEGLTMSGSTPLVDPVENLRGRLERAALDALRAAGEPLTVTTLRASMPVAGNPEKDAAVQRLIEVGEVVEVDGPRRRGQPAKYFQLAKSSESHFAPSSRAHLEEF